VRGYRGKAFDRKGRRVFAKDAKTGSLNGDGPRLLQGAIAMEEAMRLSSLFC
jgi:hypothetical protein